MTNLDFLSTEEAGLELGFQRNAVARACRENPGFGVRLNGSYRARKGWRNAGSNRRRGPGACWPFGRLIVIPFMLARRLTITNIHKLL